MDPTFTNINRLFFLSFENGNDDSTRDYFDKNNMPLVEIKDFKVLIDNKPFFDQPIKSKEKAYEKLVEMSGNNYYTIGNLLDYLYHQNYYKLIGKALLRQANTSVPQQINFTGKLGKDDGATMFSCCRKAAKNCSKLFLRFINCNRII